MGLVSWFKRLVTNSSRPDPNPSTTDTEDTQDSGPEVTVRTPDVGDIVLARVGPDEDTVEGGVEQVEYVDGGEPVVTIDTRVAPIPLALVEAVHTPDHKHLPDHEMFDTEPMETPDHDVFDAEPASEDTPDHDVFA